MIIIMSLPFYFLNSRQDSNSAKLHQYYMLFDSSDIKGTVDTLVSRFHMEAIKVNNSNQEYIFNPNITGDGALFHADTQKGDSMIKPPHSPVITVKSKDKVYTYTFQKY